MRSVVHISKFVVNINRSTRIYIYFHRPFFSVVAGGTLHFYSGFSVNDLAGVEILV